jgi:saccharopine dehydrogenase (NAD+, L-lysine-forming)
MQLKVLILGGASGDVGRNLTRVLSCEKNYIEKITVTSRDLKIGQRYIEELADKRITALQVDVTDEFRLIEAMRGHNIVINTVGPFSRYAINIIKAAINMKINYIDICDDIEPTIEALQLNHFAKKAGVTIIIGMGWFPGMSNLRTMALAKQMDDIEEIVTAWVAGRKSPENNPSLGLGGTEHFFKALSGKIVSFRDGHRVRIPVPQKGVQLEFPKPLGSCICYQLEHPEVATLPYSIVGVKDASNLMSLYPFARNTYIRLLSKMIDLKFLSLAMVTKLSSIFGKSKKKRYLPLMIGEYIACIGVKDGVKGQLCYSSVNQKLTVAEATSQPLACAILLLVSDNKFSPGVYLAENYFEIEDIINHGKKLKLSFVEYSKEKINWNEDITSIVH